jgi:hypothetical protein
VDVLFCNAQMTLHCQLLAPYQHTLDIAVAQLEAFACGNGFAGRVSELVEI